MAKAETTTIKVPELLELTATFTQDADSNSSEPQAIKVSLEDAGGGFFLAISTERWAIDSTDELVALLKRVESMGKQE